MQTIGERAFLKCAMTDLYYRGTEAQWNAIEIGSGAIPGVTVHYEYTGRNRVLRGGDSLSLRGSESPLRRSKSAEV